LLDLTKLEKLVKKMKFVYLWYVKESREALKKEMTDDKFISNWVAKVKEICKKNSAKVLFQGDPYGTVEQFVIGIESDSPPDEFGKFSGEFNRIDPAVIEYTRTEIVVLY
jgi:hypothetical protein